MSYLNADPSTPKDELLRDISSASHQTHAPGLPLRPFAALMVKLANEGGETVSDLKAHITRLNDENAKLQKWVVVLAVAALVSTFVQTAISVIVYLNPSPSQTSPVAPSASVSATSSTQLTSESAAKLPSFPASSSNAAPQPLK